MTPQSIDPVSTAVIVLSLVVGPVLAEYLGPYSVILVASFVGCLFSLRRSPPPMTRLDTVSFLARVMLLALLVTVPILEVVRPYLGNSSRWMLAPIALMVGWIGDDWPVFLRWLMTKPWRTSTKTGDSDGR